MGFKTQINNLIFPIFQRVILERKISILENRFKMTNGSKFALFSLPLWNMSNTLERTENNMTDPCISIQSQQNRAFYLSCFKLFKH